MSFSLLCRRVGVVATAAVLGVPLLGATAFAAPVSSGADHSTAGTAGTFGVVTDAQPLSRNDGDCGAYCSTRNGTASANGEGADPAGKPCAGCVGRADSKNPRGQAPDASDGDNGYECDGNAGIAHGNPAHSGCPTGTTTPTSVPAPPATGTTTDVASVSGGSTVPASVTPAQVPASPSAPAHVVATSGRSGARTPVVAPAAGAAEAPAVVLGERVTRSLPGTAAVPGVAATASSLPFTGGHTATLVLVAVLALAAGAVLVIAGHGGRASA